jgi:hypothetical protein
MKNAFFALSFLFTSSVYAGATLSCTGSNVIVDVTLDTTPQKLTLQAREYSNQEYTKGIFDLHQNIIGEDGLTYISAENDLGFLHMVLLPADNQSEDPRVVRKISIGTIHYRLGNLAPDSESVFCVEEN